LKNKQMNNKKLLLIFVKNPILGKVKTRLAASVGDEKALKIYRSLLEYTAAITVGSSCDKMVFYSDFIEQEDMFSNKFFAKTVQVQGDLGQKMFAAFEHAFRLGYQKVVIIGSDCYELSTEILNDAFEGLEQADFVIGPAKDGGYYLLGMCQLEFAIFKNKKWSQSRVYHDTVVDLEALNYRYGVLPILNDIDVVEDLPF